MRKLTTVLNGEVTLFVEELTDNRLYPNEIQIFDEKGNTLNSWEDYVLEDNAKTEETTVEEQYEAHLIEPLRNVESIDELLCYLAWDYFVASKDIKHIIEWLTSSDAFDCEEVERLNQLSFEELTEYANSMYYSLAKLGEYYVLGEF